MLYDLFVNLCKAKNVTPSMAAREAGLNKASVTYWKNHPDAVPSGKALNAITSYFGVSADYILNGCSASESVSHLDCGVHIYKSVTPVGFDTKVMEQIDAEDEEVVYQNSSVIITKDIGVDVPQDVIDNVIQTYKSTEKSKLTGDLTSREQRDIAKEVERIMASLSTSGDLMLDGVLMSDDAKRNLAVAMETALGIARKKNQETYTPKQYKAKE